MLKGEKEDKLWMPLHGETHTTLLSYTLLDKEETKK